MKLQDIFPDYGNEPKCLYCKNILTLLGHISSRDCTEYFCNVCFESFAVIHNTEEDKIFFFSLKNKNIYIDLKVCEFCVISDSKSLKTWIPYVKFDFNDKEKLDKKISTLLTFL